MVADRHLAVLAIWRLYAGVDPTSLDEEDFNTATMRSSALSRSFPLPHSLSHPQRQRQAGHCRRKLCHRVAPPSPHHFPIERANSSALLRATISTPLPSPSSLGMGALPFSPPGGLAGAPPSSKLVMASARSSLFILSLSHLVTSVGRRNSRQGPFRCYRPNDAGTRPRTVVPLSPSRHAHGQSSPPPH